MSEALKGEIWHRSDFSLLCNWRLCFSAVEIGIDRGEFAQEFLKHWRGWNYLGVDNYEPYKEMPWNRDGDKHTAISRFTPYAHTAKLAIATSEEVAGWTISGQMGWIPRSLKWDFVYLDDDHSREALEANLHRWWPLVSDHGILAGHDYHPFHPGLIETVNEFAESKGRVIYITQDDPASWYIYKSGKPGIDWNRNP